MYSRREIRRTLAAMIMLFAIMVAGAFGETYYVDESVSVSGDGSSWGVALKTIQEGIDECLASSDIVKVAQGTYVESIALKSGITLEGGYRASYEGDTARNPATYKSTINGSQTAGVISCNHVADVAIDGFTITNGMAESGGAIYCNDSSPTVSNCEITGNSAEKGGGVYCDDSASPSFTDCIIAGNEATSDGGGIYSNSNSSPSFRDCVIADNSATGDGGGVFCDNASPSVRLTNCLIIDNSSGGDGGGVFCDSASPDIINCTFSGNVAAGLGGALFMDSNCEPKVVNSILWGDSSDEDDSFNEIGGADEWKNSITITHSNVQQDGFGSGDGCTPDDDDNINCEPEFVSRGGNTNYDGYFLDQGDSPSISSGDNEEEPYGGTSNPEYSTDVSGHLDMTGGEGDHVDMGYHYDYCGCSYIELISFTARSELSSIVLTWETGAEIRNAGFFIYRAVAETGDYIRISGLIVAEGSSAFGASYTFVDSDVEPGLAYEYWLVDIETSGKWAAHGPVSARLPMSLELFDLPVAQEAMRLR